MTVIEHDRRTSTSVRDGARIRFEVEDKALGDAEVLWGERTMDDAFRIDNVPLLVFGVSTGDLVPVRGDAEPFHFDGVAERGGHSTYRVMLTDPADPQSQQRFRRIVTLGCGYEQLTPRFLAVDVPPDVNVFEVFNLLEAGLADEYGLSKRVTAVTRRTPIRAPADQARSASARELHLAYEAFGVTCAAATAPG